jgi:4a-hydroxytetrahydrobiopterin dehydratase
MPFFFAPKAPEAELIMDDLASRKCVPCHGGVPRLEGEELARLAAQLGGWEVVDGHHLSKGYKFANFAAALDFVNRVGGVAEREGHHPDISFGWGYARLTVYTHAIDGLSESDFILAAKIDRLTAS